MKNNYIVFSVDFSGASEKLLLELKKNGAELTIFSIPRIWTIYFWSIISTVSFSKKKWITRAEKKYNQLHKTPYAFNKKSRWCSKKIKHLNLKDFQGIIQISGTFDSTLFLEEKTNLYILTDYTTQLALEKKDQEIKPLTPKEKELEKWLTQERNLYLKAKKIIVPSTYITKSLEKSYGVSLNNCAVIGYGSNLTTPDSPNGKIINPQSQLNLLFVGKQFEAKGGKIILDAFKEVKKKYPHARLRIVGPRINPAPNTSDVEYLGRVYDKTQLIKIYMSSDIFLIHSYYEAFGLVLLEAMSLGLPCIGAKVDAMPDIILGSKCGSVVRLGDYRSLANEIEEYAGNTLKYSAASACGLKAISGYYNWKDVGKRFFDAISKSA